MTTEADDGQLGRRVSDLEREVGTLRQRVAELELGAGRASLIEPMVMPAFELTTPEPVAAPGPERPPTPPLVSRPVVPPPLPVVPPVGPPSPPPIPPLRPPPLAMPVPVMPEGPSPLRLFLERLQLWPPSGEGNMEARLGAWWATRLGTLLAVIGVVFLGVYASQNAAPWVRFVELLGVGVGVCLLGLWLERKIERFGSVLFGGGLALLYFCAYAAYAVDAMKVIHHPVPGVIAQLAAVFVLAAAAVWRRSSVVATMGVALGYVTAVFSRGGGMPELAMGSACLLGVVAVLFHRRWRWEAPAFIAMPATYAIGVLVLRDAMIGGTPPARGWTWLFVGGALVLYFLRDWRSARATAEAVGRPEKAFQGLNSSLAAVVGVGATLAFHRPHLEEFYFGAATVFAVLAWWRRRQVEGDPVGAVFLAKASGAFTLGVIEILEGRTTAIALLVQAWIMVYAAWRMKSRMLAVGTGLVAAVACWFFVRDALAPVTWASLAAAGQVAFVLGLALLAAEMARRLLAEDNRVGRLALESLGGGVAGLLALLAVENWLPGTWKPAMLTGLAVLLVLAAVARRAAAPGVAAVIPLVAANLALWVRALGAPEGSVLWWNALAVLLPMIAAGAVLGARRSGEGSLVKTSSPALGAAVWAIAVLGFELVVFNALPGTTALVVTAGAGLGLLVLAPRGEHRHLPWLASGAGALGVLLWGLDGMRAAPATMLALAAGLLWLPVIVQEAWGALRQMVRSERLNTGLAVVPMAAATIVTVRALTAMLTGPAETLALAVTAVAVGALVLWPGVARAMEASWVFWGVAWLTLDRFVAPEAGGTWALVAAVGVLVWIPVAVTARSTRIRAWWAEGQSWWQVAEPMQVVIAVALTIRIADRAFPDAGELIALVIAVGLALVAAGVSRTMPARVGAVVLTAWAGIQAFAFVSVGAANGWGPGLAAVLLVAATAVGVPLALAREPGAFLPAAQRQMRWMLGGAGLALAFYAGSAQTLDLRPYVTVGWGVMACAVFVAGLIVRSRPHRLLGLIGLGLCVPRVFMVDLSSTLPRVIAFVVLGVVLLLVGFSYDRFRHLISEDDKIPAEPVPPSSV